MWAIAVIAPLLWTFLASFKSNTEIFIGSPFALPDSFGLDAFTRAWTDANIGRYFLNSVLVVTLSTAGTMLFGSMAAYVLARYRFIGNRFIYYMFVSGLAFPVFLALVPLFLIVRNIGQSIRSWAEHLRRPDPRVHRVLAAVHRLLPDGVLQDAADLGGRGGDDRRRLAHPHCSSA